jgi:tetratricopeptide (TPR) repeat protein
MSIESLMEKLCQNLALELLPKLIPEPITRALLETLIGLLDEEQKASEQLRKLIGAYYKTGMEYLIDARDVQEKRREEWIQQALERFITASEVEDAILKAKSQFFVGVCYDLLNERIVAKRWYEKAFESASQQLVRLKPPIVKVVGLQFLHGTAAVVGGVTGALVGIASGGAAWAIGANVGARLGNVMGKAPQDRERRKQQQQLEELRHFMNPLSEVLLAHGSKITSRLGDVENQIRAVKVAIGGTKEQWNKDGLSRSYARQYQEAIADYDFALRLDPHYALAYNNRGVAYFNLEEYQKAIADYDRAIQLDPQFALAYGNRGVAYFNLKEYQKAIADFDQAQWLNPTKGSPYYVKKASVYNLRGTTYFNLEEYQKAIADYDRAIQLDHKNAALYNKRGVAYFNLEEYQKCNS